MVFLRYRNRPTQHTREVTSEDVADQEYWVDEKTWDEREEKTRKTQREAYAKRKHRPEDQDRRRKYQRNWRRGQDVY